jgi:hypothetical protein
MPGKTPVWEIWAGPRKPTETQLPPLSEAEDYLVRRHRKAPQRARGGIVHSPDWLGLQNPYPDLESTWDAPRRQ